LLTIGQWLLIKEITYCVLLFLAGVPYFIPSWSPYAKYAYNDFKSPLKTVFCNLFLLLLAWKLALSVYNLVGYVVAIGLDGGTECKIFQDTMEFRYLLPLLVESLFAKFTL
jgi:hypothetical protein